MSTPSEPIRVLQVERDGNFAQLTKVYLQREGDFEVRVEREPDVVPDRVATEDWDCVVSEYDISDRDGIELLRGVRRQADDFPFILFTDEGSESVASRAISAGVTDYLQKDSSANTFALLANRIRNAVEGYRAEERLRSQERLARRIVQASPIAIVVHDEDGDIVLANERANEILGADGALAADAYESADWELRDPDGERVRYDDLPFTRVVGGERLMNERFTVYTGDGRVEDIAVHGAPLRDEDGDIEGAIIPFRLADDET